jgi:glycerol-3-phosphate responsive antiterminator
MNKMKRNIASLFADAPVIAAVKDDMHLEKAIITEATVIVLLYGTVCNIAAICKKIKDADKIAIVHIDLINGLASKSEAVDFINEHTVADGIISTRQNLVKRAIEVGLYGGQRTFLVDSMAVKTITKQIQNFKPTFLEIMPGTIFDEIAKIRKITTIPLVAGGLLSSKKDILAALTAGADAVSTTREDLWHV